MVEQENGAAPAAEEDAPEKDAPEKQAMVEAESAEETEDKVAAEASQAVGEDSEEAPATESGEAEPVADEPAIDEAAASDEPKTEDAAATPKAGTDAAGDGRKAGAKRPDRKNRGKPRRALADITIGEKVNGRVVGVAKFGAFVDIGAKTDGLVHITQFPGRPKTVEEAVKSGDTVDVWVKEIDFKEGRVSLTMKEPAENPLSALLPGSVVQGTVTSVTQYGIFVDISSETEGLVHISEMSSGYVSKPEDIAKPGDSVEVRVKEIDAGRKRISLSMVGLANDSGGGEGMPSFAEADYVPEPEPDEPVPTVVELALRKALGDDDDSDRTAAGGAKRGKGSGRTDMADLYARMIEDYKQTKAEESGDSKA